MDLYFQGILIAFKGAPTTLYVSAIAVFMGVVFGLVLALMKLSKSKVLRFISTLYIEVIRDTPLIVQALIFAYGIPQILQKSGVPFKWPYLIIPAIIVCGMNSAAYVAEIIRSGLQAVDKGQMEAARSLGMTYWQAMKIVIIPQAFKIVIPAFGNEFVTMIKETCVLSYVGVVEILRRGALWNAATFNTFQAYIGVAVCYFCFTYPLSKLMAYIEKRLSTDSGAEKIKKGKYVSLPEAKAEEETA